MCRGATGACRAAFAALLLAVAVSGFVRSAEAQGTATSFVPYFGKNLVHYGNFDWQIYTTDHFEIYYYTAVKPHLERVAGYAESAYQTVSSDLKHDLAFKVPLIIFKTYVDFEQENVIPGAVREGVAAFAESTRNPMVLPLDEPPDLLYRTITHELTHIFEFDIIPQALIGREDPLWINEGLSDFMTGYWTPLDLATVRDAAVADIVPKMTKMPGTATSRIRASSTTSATRRSSSWSRAGARRGSGSSCSPSGRAWSAVRAARSRRRSS